MAFRNNNGDVIRINLVSNAFCVNNGPYVQWERATIEGLCSQLTSSTDWVRIPSGTGIFTPAW